MAELVKVRFFLDPAHAGKIKSEDVWARPLGQGKYEVCNVPFYAFDVSAEDIIDAKDQDGAIVFNQVVRRGGHSTYRVFLCDGLRIDSDAFQIAWAPIRELGCTFEDANGRWIAMDIPPATDADAAYRLLEKGEDDGVWTFEEGHCGHPLS